MTKLRELLGEPKELTLVEASEELGDDFDPEYCDAVLMYHNWCYIERYKDGTYSVAVGDMDCAGTLEECEDFLYENWVKYEYTLPSERAPKE